MVPDWPWCRNFRCDAGLTKLTTNKNADAGPTFSGIPAFTHSSQGLPTEVSCNLLSYPVSFLTALSYWAIVCCSELRCTLLSYTAFYWAMLHPTELCCILLSYAAPCELRCTHLSYAAPSELRCALLCQAAPFSAKLHPTKLRCTFLSNVAP